MKPAHEVADELLRESVAAHVTHSDHCHCHDVLTRALEGFAIERVHDAFGPSIIERLVEAANAARRMTFLKCLWVAETHEMIGDLSYGRAAKDIGAEIKRVMEENG